VRYCIAIHCELGQRIYFTEIPGPPRKRIRVILRRQVCSIASAELGMCSRHTEPDLEDRLGIISREGLFELGYFVLAALQ
jgi:hypothetical protein